MSDKATSSNSTQRYIDQQNNTIAQCKAREKDLHAKIRDLNAVIEEKDKQIHELTVKVEAFQADALRAQSSLAVSLATVRACGESRLADEKKILQLQAEIERLNSLNMQAPHQAPPLLPIQQFPAPMAPAMPFPFGFPFCPTGLPVGTYNRTTVPYGLNVPGYAPHAQCSQQENVVPESKDAPVQPGPQSEGGEDVSPPNQDSEIKQDQEQNQEGSPVEESSQDIQPDSAPVSENSEPAFVNLPEPTIESEVIQAPPAPADVLSGDEKRKRNEKKREMRRLQNQEKRALEQQLEAEKQELARKHKEEAEKQKKTDLLYEQQEEAIRKAQETKLAIVLKRSLEENEERKRLETEFREQQRLVKENRRREAEELELRIRKEKQAKREAEEARQKMIKKEKEEKKAKALLELSQVKAKKLAAEKAAMEKVEQEEKIRSGLTEQLLKFGRDLVEKIEAESVKERFDRIRTFSEEFQSIVSTKPPLDLTMTKPESSLQEGYLYNLSIDIFTRVGFNVFSIRDFDRENKLYFLKCEIEDLKSLLKSGPATLDTIAFWFETDEIRELCMKTFPSVVENMKKLSSGHYQAVSDHIEKNFKIVMDEGSNLCSRLQMRESAGEPDIWGLQKYDITFQQEELGGGTSKTLSLAQTTLVVWYTNGRLGYLAGK